MFGKSVVIVVIAAILISGVMIMFNLRSIKLALKEQDLADRHHYVGEEVVEEYTQFTPE